MFKIFTIFLFISQVTFAQNKVIIRNNIPGGVAPVYVIDTATSIDVFNVKNYGAIASPTLGAATVCTAPIQAAINDAHILGGIVYLPAGWYKSGKLESYANVTIQGDGNAATYLVSTTADTLIAIHNVVNGVTLSYSSNILVRDIGMGGSSICKVGIFVDGVANFELKRVSTGNFTLNGFCFKNCLVGTINDCNLQSSQIGILGFATGAGATTLVAINNCVILFCTKWAVEWSGGGQLQVNNLDMEANGIVTDSLTGGIYYHDNGWPGGLRVYGGWCEQSFGTDIYIKNNVSFQGSNYPLTTHHSIIGWQNIGHQYDFTKRNIAIIGNNQRLEISGGSIVNGAITNIVADGTNNQVFVSAGSFFENKIERGGATVTQQ